jgi:hypothetical protein
MEDRRTRTRHKPPLILPVPFEKDGSLDRLELAKDMAAFANALGAYQDTKRGHLGVIKGITDEDVKRVRDAYSQAASGLGVTLSPLRLHTYRRALRTIRLHRFICRCTALIENRCTPH